MKLTAEQLMKARSAKSAEELMELAKADGIEVTEEQATEQFTMLHSEGELADNELNNVSGGGCGGGDGLSEPFFKFKEGSRVRVKSGTYGGKTGTVTKVEQDGEGFIEALGSLGLAYHYCVVLDGSGEELTFHETSLDPYD